jgi:hypothetical protein
MPIAPLRVLRSFRRLLLRTLLVLAAIGVAAAAWDVCTYDADAWHRDYAHLKHELAHRYANLDWVVEHRGLDLPALDRETEAAILGAHSRVRAFLALRRFVRAFGDPHLRLGWGHRDAEPASATPAASQPQPAASQPQPAASQPQPAASQPQPAASQPQPAASQPQPAASQPQPAGLATLDEAGYEIEDRGFRFPFHELSGWTPLRDGPFPTGIARDLGVLRIASFGEDRYREVAALAFAPGQTRRALQLATRARLQQHLREAIGELLTRGARRLVVDVTGNGGGTEWVTEVVTLFTDRELSRRSARLLATGVDRSGVFAGRPVPSVLAPETAPVRRRGTGEWTGPLFVLADNHTGSAAEDFVVWLQENGVAKVLGQRTAGAGGGYVDGGGWIRLSAAPCDVRAPNCARFLADGTNELEGVKPDVELPLGGLDDAALATSLAAAVGR